MMQEIVAARISAGGLEGEVTLRITGISREDADRWVRSREDLLGGRAELVSRWTAPDRVLEAAVQAPNADGLIKTLLRMGWTYAPSFERTIQTPAGSDPYPMCRCDVPETPFRRLLDQNTAHRIAHDMIREVLEKEKGRRKAAEVRVEELERDNRSFRRANEKLRKASELDAELRMAAEEKARDLKDQYEKAMASLQEADAHMSVLDMQLMKLHRKHWKAARLVGGYRRTLERVAADNSRLRKQLVSENPMNYIGAYVTAIEHAEGLSEENKRIAADLVLERDHTGMLEQQVKKLEGEKKLLESKIAVQEAHNTGIVRKNIALKAALKAEQDRRKQDLSFLSRDLGEGISGLVLISERIEALRSGKEPHPYKHNKDRKD